MTAKRVTLALVAMMAIVLSMVMIVPAARADTSVPTWSNGDYWLYTTTGTNLGPTTFAFGSGTVRYDVVGTDSITVGGSTYSAYRTKVNYTFMPSGSTQNISLNGEEWFRTSDLAPAKETISTPPILGVTYSLTIQWIPPAQIQWPLTATSSWTVTTTINITSTIPGFPGGSASGSFNEAGQADMSLTVAAGTFTVTPVKDTTAGSTSYYMTYWSATAGNAVARRGYDSSGNQAASMDLKSYSYSGGGFLNQVFLGLSVLVWLIIIVVVVVVIAAVVLLVRRKPKAPMMMPPGMPPTGMGPGMPPGQMPEQPPQQPGMPPGPPPQP